MTGPNNANTVSGESIQFYKYSAANPIPVVIWGPVSDLHFSQHGILHTQNFNPFPQGFNASAKWVNDKDDLLFHRVLTLVLNG